MIRKEQLNIVYLLILASCFYFSVLPYVIRLVGIEVESGYYQLQHYTSDTFILLFLLNSFYFFFTAIGFYYSLFKVKIRNFSERGLQINSLIVYVIVGFAVAISFSYLSLMRNEIKDSSSLGIEVVFLTALTLISYSTYITKKKIVLFVNIILILYFSFVLFEREVILYALVPFLLRMGLNRKGVIKFAVFFSILTLLVLNYKVIINVIKSGDYTHYSSTPSRSPLYSLGVDSVHKMSLEVSYFEGNSPDYNRFTIYVPYQILRFFEPERTTNARLATEFYTSNKTGTGFSFLLEGLLNFSFPAVFLLPVLLAFIFYWISKIFGIMALTPFVVFIVKVQRSELWPLMISTLLLPLICILLIFQAQKLFFTRHEN